MRTIECTSARSCPKPALPPLFSAMTGSICVCKGRETESVLEQRAVVLLPSNASQAQVPMTKAKATLPHVEDNKSKKPRVKKNDGSTGKESDKAYIGQEVHGIVDGTFDAGYLLTVKVGDSPLIFRGLIFAPGLMAPLSKSIDVAPAIQATARDQQVMVPTSRGVLHPGEFSSTVRAASTRVVTRQGLGNAKQEQADDGRSNSAIMSSVEQRGIEHSYVSEDVKYFTHEKGTAGSGGSQAHVEQKRTVKSGSS